MIDPKMEQIAVEQAEFLSTHFFGKYRGLVRHVDDPERLGRIIVQVPEIYGEKDSPWALPSVPFAGKNHGFVVLPEVHDGVWVEFEAGDISRPIWVGCWWAKEEMPEPGGTETRVLVTSGGHKVILDDDKKEFKFLHSGGLEITMTDDGKVRILGTKKVVVEAPQIELVENAAHPLVFGDQLLQYLNQLVMLYNTHLHIGQQALGVFPVTPAPPATPQIFPPATSALISKKVKTG